MGRGFDTSVVDSPEVVLLEGTVSQLELGLARSLHEQLQTFTTHTIDGGRFFDYYDVHAMLTNAGARSVEFNLGRAFSRTVSRAPATSLTWPSILRRRPFSCSLGPLLSYAVVGIARRAHLR